MVVRLLSHGSSLFQNDREPHVQQAKIARVQATLVMVNIVSILMV